MSQHKCPAENPGRDMWGQDLCSKGYSRVCGPQFLPVLLPAQEEALDCGVVETTGTRGRRSGLAPASEKWRHVAIPWHREADKSTGKTEVP